MTFRSAGLGVLFKKEECFYQETQQWFHRTGVFKISTCLPWAPHLIESTGKKGVTVLAGVIGPDYQGEIELLLQNAGKENMSRIQEIH